MNNVLYSSGPYWQHKNAIAILETKKGLVNFRGVNVGIGQSFADNIVLDVENMLNLKWRFIRRIFSLPILNKVFDRQLRITKNHIDSYLKHKAIVYKNDKNVKYLLNKYKFENTTNFGCVSNFKHHDVNYSCHYIEMADRIDKLSSSFNFSKIKSFFEIGGGFGSNIHFLITNFPNIKKILYLDIVPNIYVGTEYLRYHYKDKVKDYTYLKNLDEINFSENEDLEILCIPPWLIEKVNVKIDHFHNANSFVEMPNRIIENYVKFIKKFETKEVSLISYDGFNPKTTFNPEKLNNFFDMNLNISWKNFLIEDYNNRFLYLTSG